MTVDEDFNVKIAEVRIKFAEFLKENNLRICCSSYYDRKDEVKKNYMEIYYDSLLLYSTECNEETDKIEYTDLLKG